MPRQLKIKNLINSINYPLAIFILTFLIYVHNLSPSVHGGDAGDLLSAALTKGIAHPSGYPLYTMLGIIFTSLPLPFTPAWKFGLVSALFSSLSVVVLYKMVLELTKNRYLAIITSLTLAFTYPFWLYAEIVEVFALNSFFILTLIFFTIKYAREQKVKYLYWLSFFTGLSLTNNLSIILLFPAILITIFLTKKKLLLDYKTILKSLFFLLLGLTPYIYIPIAANSNPLVNWGKAVNLENFFHLVLRKDYGWTPIPGREFNIQIPIDRIHSYLDYWFVYLNPLIAILSSFGFLYLLTKKKIKLFFLFVISYLLFGPFVLIYPRNPSASFLVLATFEKFYIAGIVVLIILSPFGTLSINEFITKILNNKTFISNSKRAVLAVFSLIPIISFLTNFQKTNLSKVYIGDNFAKDIIGWLPKDSVLLIKDDSKIFNTLYMQIAYNFRNDVYLPGRHDGMKGILNAIGMNDEEVKQYSIKYKSAIEQKTLYTALPALVLKNTVFTDFKSDFEIIDKEQGKILFIPYGLVFNLEFEDTFNLTKDEYLKKVNNMISNYQTNDFEKYRFILNNNLVLADIQKQYANAYFNISKFLATYYEDEKSALPFFQKALELDPLIQNTEGNLTSNKSSLN